MKRIRIVALLLTAVLCSSMVLSAAAAGTASGQENGFLDGLMKALFSEEEFHDSGCASIPKLSTEELRQLLADNPVELPEEYQHDYYDETPSCEPPYSTGKVRQEVLQLAANRLNMMRRIAGLPAAKLDASLSENAQYGAVLLARIGKLEHRSPNPGDMPDWFYKKAYEATSTSNLDRVYWNYTGMNREEYAKLNGPAKSVDSCMRDDMVPSLGHRSWILSPRMGKVGFGYVGWINLPGSYSLEKREYTVQKVMDTSANCSDYSFIAWPCSGNYPSSLSMDYWSINLNPNKFQTPKDGKVTVTITRESDGKVWTLNRVAGEDGTLLVENTGYGYTSCLVIRPKDARKDSPDNLYHGLYTVRVDGLVSSNGRSVNTFEYQVNFVDA